MNIGIIGCGLIGKKRSKSIGNNTLKAAADIKIENAYDLVYKNYQIKIFTDYKDLIILPEIDIIIISTINNTLSNIVLESINAKKHVLVEKPGVIHYTEFDKLIEAAKKNNVCVKIGYNLRYHPGIKKAKELIDSGIIGDLMFIRGHYGNGARLGFEKEWRANPKISGGGCLMDLGVHLIDLSQWFLGDFTKINGSIHTYFWDMPVEDNAFLHLETINKKTAFLSVSYTEWRNTFIFEIYGKLGKIQISGLGNSYGTEKLTLYKMRPEMGIPDITTWEFHEDNSFEKEFEDFVNAIKNNREIRPNLEDGKKILEIVDKIYEK